MFCFHETESLIGQDRIYPLAQVNKSRHSLGTSLDPSRSQPTTIRAPVIAGTKKGPTVRRCKLQGVKSEGKPASRQTYEPGGSRSNHRGRFFRLNHLGVTPSPRPGTLDKRLLGGTFWLYGSTPPIHTPRSPQQDFVRIIFRAHERSLQRGGIGCRSHRMQRHLRGARIRGGGAKRHEKVDRVVGGLDTARTGLGVH
ncbi:hypothetical protein B0H17DRAFT_1248555 [Mycena rosella]|uniref:Uncharacterized protein n=1 Tax=Mycena rosella TaxID=1033263 RepID=A0AAD7CXL2_MYCRO|nr:hypothetical protein B0H17DRAFT_1248555 [Mycena rosella]